MVMNITPIISDGYNGPIKRLTCRICKHLFYITQDDYHRLQEVRFCHECSLILLEELQNNQGASALRAPSATKAEPVVSAPPRLPLQPSPPAHMLTMLDRPREALVVYEEVLRLEPATAMKRQSNCVNRRRNVLLIARMSLDHATRTRLLSTRAWALRFKA